MDVGGHYGVTWGVGGVRNVSGGLAGTLGTLGPGV